MDKVTPEDILEYFYEKGSIDKNEVLAWKKSKEKKEYEILTSYPLNRNEIHSIKRLSDGEIFTVGDKCKKGIIAEFEPITFGRLNIIFENTDYCYTPLDILVKVKQPCFKTEDGVQITDENQALYAVLTKAQWETRTDTVKRMRERSSFSTPLNPAWKYFSTDEARQGYILKNKPVLSVNDIIAIGHTWLLGEGGEESRYCAYFSHSKLIELAKSKLINP